MSEIATPGKVFECSFGPYGPAELTVVSFTGKEETSRPFRFEITLAVASVDQARFAADVLGSPGVLTLHAAGGSRHIHGVACRVQVAAVDLEKHLSWYVVRLVPRLWVLGSRKTSRIFQERTVPEIVTEVLEGASIAHEWKLAGQHGKRTYSVQYQETDLDYISRLLAEEGIFYFFEEPAGGEGGSEVLVLADLAAHYPKLPGDAALPLVVPSGMARTGDTVEHFALREQLRSGSSRMKHFDFRRPDTDLSSSADALRPKSRFDESTLGVYEYDFAAEDDAAVAGAAARRLEQLRVRRQVGEGLSRCRRLAPGRRFQLEGHPEERMNREYVVVRITHEGRQPEAALVGGPVEVYKNRFDCLPAEVAARPPRRRRRIQQVLETATVVGPAGEEIHTDEHGRIKVAFHWDRRGARDERSSCWIRCMQTWAGASWGFQFVPRIGMEVLVTFMGGDVDQPMVIGCAYNGTHPPPFPLPASKTRSGIRTRSTPGGEGSNELMFEDAASQEQIYLHAQRDFEEVVEHDHRRLVRGDEEVLVQGTRETTVAEDHLRTVRGNEVVTIEKDLVLHVIGRQRIVVEGRAPSSGAEGESATPEPAPAPSPAAAPEIAAAGPAAPEASLPPVDQESRDLQRAKLVWSMASLPDDLRASGAEIERRAGEVASQVSALRTDVTSWLAAGRPPAEVKALESRTAEARTAVLHAMVHAGMAVDDRMAKVRDAAQDELKSALLETQRAQIALVATRPLARDSMGHTPRGGGAGRGGGGTVTTKDKQKLGFHIGSPHMQNAGQRTAQTTDGSVFEFSNGGKIISKDGFAIEVGGTTLTMNPGGIEIVADFIALYSKGNMEVKASGDLILGGSVIKLN